MFESICCLPECVVVNVPLMTDGIDAENTDKINIKVQGNDANLKKSFQVSKVNPFFPSVSGLLKSSILYN